MLRTSSIHIYDHFDLYLTPVTLTFNLLKICFKWHFSSSRAITVPNCFEIHALLYKLWSGQIRTDARADAWTHWCTHIHQTNIVTTMSRLPASGIDKNVECRFLFSAHRLMMVYICTKFHENILNCIRVMEGTLKVNGQTDVQTDRGHNIIQPVFDGHIIIIHEHCRLWSETTFGASGLAYVPLMGIQTRIKATCSTFPRCPNL